MRYHFKLVVQRVVEDTLTLSVDAERLGEAKQVAEEVALGYPHGNTDVPYCYIENRDTIESRLIDIERVVPTNDETA